ncbi:carbohydrate ABC transporter permease [Catellatospora citrea]|uniref:Sugar ABC transporter permease n=1 Tax=Catellatospora citrea TaxID=53366 RepID=A0A8J3KJD7_9ACTN|nr:carbohydrate ABC transporter permease [Catellatospora citrea]RKE05708.1 carbohydrate ABC transporter membrane protein 2 (CUT1 family) [Catellatospora citrea]GIF97069.1 sugar ABC transporter permease [Catellatospora citrea]
MTTVEHVQPGHQTAEMTARAGRPARPRRRRRGLLTTIVWYLLLLALAAVVLYPLVWLFFATLKPSSEFGRNSGLLPWEPTLDNYARVWDGIAGIPLWRYGLNSLIVASLAVVGTLGSSALAGYAFARVAFKGSKILFAAMIGTLLLPFHVIIIPQYIIFNQLDLLDTYVPLLIGKFLGTEAFFVFLMVQFIRNIPRELDEAARIDGAGHPRIFWSIVVPLLRPALVTGGIFSFIWTWNDFLGPLIYLTSPENYTLPIALRLYNDTTSTSDYGATVAASLLSLIPVLLFFLIFQRMLIRGVATQGLKG